MKISKFCFIALSAILFCACASSKRAQMTDETVGCAISHSLEDPNDGDQICFSVEDMPKFMGGNMNTFGVWVSQNIRYPKGLSQEHRKNIRRADNPNRNSDEPVRVKTISATVSFIIEKDGSVGNITIIDGSNSALNDEVIRVLRSSPRWDPGRNGGEPARAQVVIPVSFHLR